MGPIGCVLGGRVLETIVNFTSWFLLVGSLGAGFGAVAIAYVLRARVTAPAPERIVDLLRTESGGFRERESST